MSTLFQGGATVENSLLKGGTGPCQLDHRDFDLIKTHKAAGLYQSPVFPESYQTDLELWMPSQNDYEPIFKNGPMPWACTDYTQADLAADASGVLKNPLDLEHITHANARFGADIRESLKAALYLGWLTNFFSIRPNGNLDAFDAIRYAMMTGIPEKRSVSWGTPWFPSWEKIAQSGNPIMPMPTEAELSVIRKDPNALSWHNSKFAGFVTKNGVPYLRNKSWQGEAVGDKGWLYFPREVVNAVMALPYTVAFIGTATGKPAVIKQIDVSVLQWLLSFTRNYLKFSI